MDLAGVVGAGILAASFAAERGGGGQPLSAELEVAAQVGHGRMPGCVVPTLLAARVCDVVGFGYLRRELLQGRRTAGWVVEGAPLLLDGRRDDSGSPDFGLHRSGDILSLTDLAGRTTPVRAPGPGLTLDVIEGDTATPLRTPDGIAEVRDQWVLDHAEAMVRGLCDALGAAAAPSDGDRVVDPVAVAREAIVRRLLTCSGTVG